MISKPHRRVNVRLWAGAGLLALFAWIAIDLWAPRTSHLRDFDPEVVARQDAVMWRSYYERRRARLFGQMAELLRSEYRLPWWRSNVVALQATRAAFVFKRGHQRADYERALPDLERYYRSIRAVSDIPFDVRRAAQLELEWWIVHRERNRHTPADLPRALADLEAEIYRLPPERFQEHARLRAEAMTIRDDRAAAGGVTEADWTRIEQLLHDSWRSLFQAVNAAP